MKEMGECCDRNLKGSDGYEGLPRWLRSFFWGFLLLPRSEISRNTEAIAKKVYEKRPHEARFCELHKVLIF